MKHRFEDSLARDRIRNAIGREMDMSHHPGAGMDGGMLAAAVAVIAVVFALGVLAGCLL